MRRAVALAVVAAAACSASKEPISGTRPASGEPRVVEARQGLVEETMLLSGELEAKSSIELTVPRTDTWQLTIQFLSEDGEELEAGARAVEFDNSAFTANLEQQRLLVKQARRDHATQRSLQKMTIGDKQHALDRARLARDRSKLYADVSRELLPERDWQERQLAHERAIVAVLSAEADLEAATKEASLDLEVKQIELEKAARAVDTAEASIAALTLTTPEGGLALVAEHPWEGRKLAAGDTVQPGWIVVELPDLSDMRIAARLSDVDDGKVEVGTDAVVVFDAFPGRVAAGKIESITAVAREVGWQSLQRAFDVRVSIAKTEPWMRPGMSARVEVVSAAASEAVVIPRAAVREASGDGREGGVRLASGETRPIKLGPCSATECAVSEGLTVGERVVVGGSP